jgi:competence ComEA-like helix-hairpin-helix protein
MRVFSSLQQTFGFTRNESNVVVILASTFLVGLGIRWYQSAHPAEPATKQFDYSRSDSVFQERSKAIAALAAQPSAATPNSYPRAGTKPSLAPGSININTASKERLMQLPGIGATYAERIVRYRKEHGPFRSARELLNVNGIGEKKFARLKALLTVK